MEQGSHCQLEDGNANESIVKVKEKCVSKNIQEREKTKSVPKIKLIIISFRIVLLNLEYKG